MYGKRLIIVLEGNLASQGNEVIPGLRLLSLDPEIGGLKASS